MLCISCGHDNPPDAAFCMKCGSQVEAGCPKCGKANVTEAAFCISCGTALGGAATPLSPPAPPLPDSFVEGRYLVKSFLGEGGRKRVYLAHDARLDRDVAFATIKTEGLDQDGVERVRREAQAMGRLGDHPHIVTIYDVGEHEGSHYIVSQFMSGGAVEDLLSKAEGQRLATADVLRIAGEVCQALEHAHSRGIVHRDLKPGNVWLASDGTAQLGDFGLAVSLDRSRMTMQGMMVGTVAYMSPEQALGRTPDARSDLYSLGAMLYEMVAGRPPFVGDDAIGIISQHINTAPVAPSWHNPELPRALEPIILRLLAKPPEDRFTSADEVLAALSQISQASSQESIVQPVSEVAGGELGGLEWGRFVGRQEEMDQLKESLEKALSGRGALALIAGEPGVGKTRLVDEFTVYARMRGAQVLFGRCYEGESSAPYRPFAEALRRYVRAQPDPAVREQLGTGAPEVATLVSEIRERFPDLPQPMNVEGEAQRMRLFDAVTSFLRTASRTQPLVLFFDDLQWADRPSLALLKYLARESGEDRLLVVGTYRDVEIDDKHPLSEVLPELRRTLNYRRIGLQGLSREEVRDMMEALEPSPEARQQAHLLAAILYRETEGNPLFIREVVNSLIEEGKLFREGGHWTSRATTISELGIPDSVRDVVQRRITRLSEPCRRVLTRASAMTHGFTWEALKAISGEDEATLLDILDEALAAQIIAERGDQSQLSYDFTQTLIRQSLREELSRPRWIILHREIGEVLEKLYADNIDAHLSELAHHFYRAAPGGDTEKAIDYSMRAGHKAMQLNGWEDAIDNFTRALELMPDHGHDDKKFRAYVSLGALQLNVGRPADAVDAYRDAASAARSLGDIELLGEAACGFETAGYFVTGDGIHRERLHLIDEALAGLESGDSALRARLLAHRTRPAHTVSAGDDAVRSAGVGSLLGHRDPEILRGAREAVALARRVGDPAAAALACERLLEWLLGPADAAEALEVSQMDVQFAREAGNKVLECQGEIWAFGAALALGDIAAARGFHERGTRLAEQSKIGWQHWQSLARTAMLSLMEGHINEAESGVFEALSFGQAINHPTALTTFGAQLFCLRWYQGRVGEMEAMFRGLHEQSPETEAYAAAFALMFAETGRPEEARDLLSSLAARGFDAIPEDGAWGITVTVLSEAFARLATNVTEESAALYDVASRYPDGNASSGMIISLGSRSRSCGQLATLLERWDDAERHFQDALDLNQAMGHRPALAQVRRDYAIMLVRRDGPGDRARALPFLQQALDAAQEMGMQKLVEDCLALKLEAQGVDRAEFSASAGFNTSIDRVATAVEYQHPDLRKQAAPDGTVTIMFSDIEGSTEKTAALGDTKWMEVLRDHGAIIREQLKAHDGFEVKSEGDGFMMAFQSARKALQCAIAMQKAFAAHNELVAAHPEEARGEGSIPAHPEEAEGRHEGRAATQTPQIRVRMGLHTGEVIKDGDDFFGIHVNLAARVASQATGGEILASSLLKELTASGGDIAYGEPRTVEFKGIEGQHQVWPVEWSS